MKSKKNIIVLVIIILAIAAIIAGIIICKNTGDKSYELEKVEQYSYFKLYQNERYGVMDRNGNVLIEATYDVVNIPNPSKPVFICYYDYNEETNEYKTKVLNDKKEQILTSYEQVLPLLCEESTSSIPFEKSVLKYKENDKYGIIDFSGKKITKAIYDSIESLQYREGSLLVSQNQKYGVINIKGKQIIKIEYDKVESDGYYTEDADYTKAGFIVQNKTDDGYRYGYIDKDGKQLLDENYNEINRITDIKSDIYLLVSQNGKYGIVKDKKLLINQDYEEIEYNKVNRLFIVQKNSKQGVYGVEGKEILPVEYDYILCSENKITTTKGESIDIYNVKGEKQDIKYDNCIETTNDNYIIEIDNDNKFGVVNKNDRILIENEYEYMEYAFGDYFIATKNGKVGVINVSTGSIVIDFKYDIVQKVKDKDILQAIISSSNTIEMYNNTMVKQVSIKDAILYTYDNYVKLISNTDMKYLDNVGNLVSTTKLFTNNKLFAYSNNKKWGFVDINGKAVVEAKYDLVTEFNEYGFAGIKKNGKWGVVNSNGEVIVEPKYEISWNEPEFINKYCKMNFGYGFEYYTDQI